jgi:(1->4)-alpha-D-glucan 1-alpha-D-glucosylmutase
MTPPRATMRLQLHRGFTLDDAAAVVPYIAALGISHLYLSPILTARSGSQHGYDVVDPSRVNPELGGEEALHRLSREMQRHGLGIIADIVPNHMAIGAQNPWWMDVLRHGRDSHFAKYFDIDWTPPDRRLHGKIALPILGRPYGEALAEGEITLHRENGQACIRYFDHLLPLADGTLDNAQASGQDFDHASTSGRERLHLLLESQHYRLMWWRSANDEINWRRFFDINELVAIRVEDDDVFEAIHAKIFALYAGGVLDGLRVDHVDGLSRPDAYCKKLRERLRSLQSQRPGKKADESAYLVVEKILSRGETLPADWQTDGTTGYDFMDEISALHHAAQGEQPLNALWRRASQRNADFPPEELLARRQILQRSFGAQHEATVQAFYAVAQSDLRTRDISSVALRRCLAEILVHFPVYRTYASPGHATAADEEFVVRAVAGAKETCLPGDRWLIGILAQWLSGKPVDGAIEIQTIALTRFAQLSAPLCAKAVEDTAFYRYGRLISRNDVGFDARLFSCPVVDFHQRMQARATHFPHALLATATHDHKRGEDVRARLAVLSELATDWSRAVELWLDLAAARCTAINRKQMPYGGDLAILFQMIVGAWPLMLSVTDKPALSAFAGRLAAWQIKALREAKLFSDWSAPNAVYENAATDFIDSLFAEPSDLLEQLAGFAQRIAPAGAANGLAQTLIKLTAPGIPDHYQGTEYWDLSLVDPDNRAPIDFSARRQGYEQSYPDELTATWRDGRVKQSLIARILAARKQQPALFSDGAYVPLETSGPLAAHVVAFARTFQSRLAVAAALRLPAHIVSDDDKLGVRTDVLHDTYIHVPGALRGATCSSVLHRDQKHVLQDTLRVSDMFEALPVGLIIGQS